jgi:hypothetical protein
LIVGGVVAGAVLSALGVIVLVLVLRQPGGPNLDGAVASENVRPAGAAGAGVPVPGPVVAAAPPAPAAPPAVPLRTPVVPAAGVQAPPAVVAARPADLPKGPGEQVPLNLLNREPAKYVGRTLSFPATVHAGYVGRGTVCELQVVNDNGVRPVNLYFTTSRDIATQWTDEGGRPGAADMVTLTGRVTGRTNGNQTVVEVVRIDLPGLAGGPPRTIPSAPQGGPGGTLSMAQVNRTPESFVGKVVTLPAVLCPGFVGRGPVNELQVLTDKGLRPTNVYFVCPRALATAWTDEGPRDGNPTVRLSGRVTDRKNGPQTIIEVEQIELLGPDGNVTKAFR